MIENLAERLLRDEHFVHAGLAGLAGPRPERSPRDAAEKRSRGRDVISLPLSAFRFRLHGGRRDQDIVGVVGHQRAVCSGISAIRAAKLARCHVIIT
jgi:hypothetical protein